MSHMYGHTCFLLVFSLLGLLGCRAMETKAQGADDRLTVFAAASLITPFEEIADAFEAQHPGVEVMFNFAGSQELAQQISEGAPADVFASADQAQMDVAVSSGRIDGQSMQTFVQNRLIVVMPEDNPARIEQLQDLGQPGVALVIADKSVPAGRYTLEFLQRASRSEAFDPVYIERVLANVVSYEQNVRAVLSRVQLGEADAGIVYASDAAGTTAALLPRLEIPDALNPTAAYPIAILEDSKQQPLAETFVAFVLSRQGQQRLKKHGFIPVLGTVE